MTDEEIAEEYLDKRYLKDMGIREPVKKALLYGLAKARKESKSCIELLQNEKAELAEDFCKQLAELKAQIEKMQCCGNCSKRNQCEMNVIDSLHCDKWEKEV